ncbi:hypothetical protein ACFQ1R_03435 [Mariniflexile jejuense]|uniref:DoxX-like protein n=1 Tax=Mariniflexile jejuense TaxID=1173582 RepID=A0ABW3JH40_9FLAO
MTKNNKIISSLLGLSMFTFGVLKFLNPFKSWYATQIKTSQLPFQEFLYWSGQLSEIIVGIIILYLLKKNNKGEVKVQKKLFLFSNFIVIFIMIIATYVHIQPNVPNEVLPLKIKPPFIPGMFFGLAIINIILFKKAEKQQGV